MCIQTRLCTHAGGHDTIFIHKIKRSQKCDMAVKKVNTVLDYRERWWPNPRTQRDAEEVTKSQKSGGPGSTIYICVVLDPSVASV